MNNGMKLALLAIFSLAMLVICPLIGGVNVNPLKAMLAERGSVANEIFLRIRIPRNILAFIAGASLSLCGMVFQSIFRNPLATPFTLGVSSGAAFGASIFVRLGLGFSIMGISGISLFAFAGGLISIMLVYGLTQTRKGSSPATMLLAGVAVSFFFSSLILIMQYMSDYANSFRILRWMMGGIETIGYGSVVDLSLFFLIGSTIIFFHLNELNLLSTGEEIAASRGVEVNKNKTLLFFTVSFMVGAVVSICGPIGFVGMIVPHICRLLLGWNHRILFPAVMLFGGAFLTLCDTIARTIIAPAELPVGIITSILGGPFFLWLLMTKRNSY